MNISDIFQNSENKHIFQDILEQPETIIKTSKMCQSQIKDCVNLLNSSNCIYVTGCGSSLFSALFADKILNYEIGMNIKSEESTQLKLNKFPQKSVLLALSQSGESKNVLEAVSFAKEQNIPIIAIVNSKESTLGREANISLEIHSGIEKGLVSTKSFTSQLVSLYSIIFSLKGEDVRDQFQKISSGVQTILSNQLKNIQNISIKLKNAERVYILGDGINYPIAKEGEQKLLELTRIPTNAGFPNTVFHAATASMESLSYAIVINPDGDNNYYDMLDRINILKQRGAHIIGISNKNHPLYDDWIEIPTIKHSMMYPLLTIIPIQLLSFYTCIAKGADPNNLEYLAKVFNEKIMGHIIRQAKIQNKPLHKTMNTEEIFKKYDWLKINEILEELNTQLVENRLSVTLINKLIECTFLNDIALQKDKNYVKKVYSKLHSYFKDIFVYYNLGKKDVSIYAANSCRDLINNTIETERLRDITESQVNEMQRSS